MESILLIPDTQIIPGCPTEHLVALGNYAITHKPEYIVNIGDHWDFPSLSSYDIGKKAHEGARYQEDIEAGYNALLDFEEPIALYNRDRRRSKHRIYNPVKYFTTGNHECFPEDTQVLTKERGWINIDDVNHEDLVLTHKGNWQHPKYFVKNLYNGLLKKYNSRTISLTCTPNHELLYTSNNSGKIHKKIATDVPASCDVFVSVGVDNEEYNLTDAQLRYSAVAVTDSYHYDKNINFYQSEKKADVIRNIIIDSDIDFTEKKRDRNITNICGRELKSCQSSYEFYMKKPEWCPDNNKRLPGWVVNLSNRQWKIFLDTLIYCDGTLPTGGIDSLVFYGKKEICDDVQLACVVHGYRATISEYRTNQFRVNITHTNLCRVENFMEEEEYYEGFVYCFGVDDESFVIKQNEKPIVVGNCRLERYVNDHPVLEGKLSYDDLGLEKLGWKRFDYLDIVDINGVKFSHKFLNPDSLSRRPFSSSIDTQLKTLGFSFVAGHLPGLQIANPRYGIDGRITRAVITGSFHLHDFDYQQLPQGNQYWRGAIHLENVKDGNFILKELPIDWLMENYL